jgi:hypothetical protein
VELDPVVARRIFGAPVAAFAAMPVLREVEAACGRRVDDLRAARFLAGGGLLFVDPWPFHSGDFGAEGNQHTWQGLFAVSAGVLESQRGRRR